MQQWKRKTLLRQNSKSLKKKALTIIMNIAAITTIMITTIMITTIMTTIIMTMSTVNAAAKITIIITIMRTRFSQAGEKRQHTNILPKK